jgi:hypothetical protein
MYRTNKHSNTYITIIQLTLQALSALMDRLEARDSVLAKAKQVAELLDFKVV